MSLMGGSLWPKEKEEALESPTGGSRPMNIGGRMVWERERCIGMTDAERAWRSQWLKDQVLHDEPVIPPNYYKERYNPIRRFYKAPMNIVENAIAQRYGLVTGKTVRHLIANIAIGVTMMWGMFYWVKYNPGDWTRKTGARVGVSRIRTVPGDPDFPGNTDPLPDKQYASYGFLNSKI